MRALRGFQNCIYRGHGVPPDRNALAQYESRSDPTCKPHEAAFGKGSELAQARQKLGSLNSPSNRVESVLLAHCAQIAISQNFPKREANC